MVIRQLLEWGAAQLQGVADQPMREARILFSFTSAMPIERIIVQMEDQVDEAAYRQAIAKRKTGCPVAYITGQKEFYGLPFLVSEHVLVPRPDTETLVDYVINGDFEKTDILDLCTGSGCIAISLAKHISGAEIDAVDISEKALDIAHENAKKNGVQERVQGICHDIFEPFVPDKQYDVLVSNPPYIPQKDMDDLMADVRNFEPHLALAGGEDGLGFYRRIAHIAPWLLKENGRVVLECGIGQAQDIAAMFAGKRVHLVNDLRGIPRVVAARF